MKVTAKVATKSLTFVPAALVAFLTLWKIGGKTINTVYADKLACGGSTAVSNTMITDYKLSY